MLGDVFKFNHPGFSSFFQTTQNKAPGPGDNQVDHGYERSFQRAEVARDDLLSPDESSSATPMTMNSEGILDADDHWLPSGGNVAGASGARINGEWFRDATGQAPGPLRGPLCMESTAPRRFPRYRRRVYHDGHYRREGVDAQIAKGHRRRKVDERNLHHNRGCRE